MINNNVDFSFDPDDGMYVATIKIVNKATPVHNQQDQQSADGNITFPEQEEEQQSFHEDFNEDAHNGSMEVRDAQEN